MFAYFVQKSKDEKMREFMLRQSLAMPAESIIGMDTMNPTELGSLFQLFDFLNIHYLQAGDPMTSHQPESTNVPNQSFQVIL